MSALRRLTARWTRLALPDAPVARSSHGLSAIDGRAYLFGGEATARHAIDSTLHRLDPASGWTTILPAHAPPPRVGHAQAAVGGRLLVFGGRSGVEMGERELGDLWSFCPRAGAWSELSAVGAPTARSFHAATAAGDTLYIFGGCGADGRLADLHAYSATTDSWRALPPPPALAGRGGAALEAAADGSALWLAGGFVGHETNDLLRFCTRTHAWERAPSDWLRPRSVCASFAFGGAAGVGVAAGAGVVCLFGGEVSPSDRGHEGAGGFASDLVAVDARDGVPLSVAAAGDAAEAPPARGWAAAAALSGSEAVLFGGLAGSDAEPARLGDAWLLRLDED